jgi:hypothetical protein
MERACHSCPRDLVATDRRSAENTVPERRTRPDAVARRVMRSASQRAGGLREERPHRQEHVVTVVEERVVGGVRDLEKLALGDLGSEATTAVGPSHRRAASMSDRRRSWQARVRHIASKAAVTGSERTQPKVATRTSRRPPDWSAFRDRS